MFFINAASMFCSGKSRCVTWAKSDALHLLRPPAEDLVLDGLLLGGGGRVHAPVQDVLEGALPDERADRVGPLAVGPEELHDLVDLHVEGDVDQGAKASGARLGLPSDFFAPLLLEPSRGSPPEGPSRTQIRPNCVSTLCRGPPYTDCRGICRRHLERSAAGGGEAAASRTAFYRFPGNLCTEAPGKV